MAGPSFDLKPKEGSRKVGMLPMLPVLFAGGTSCAIIIARKKEWTVEG
jgi:hypothetical protein